MFFFQIVLLGSSLSIDPDIQSFFDGGAIGMFHPCFNRVFVLALRDMGFVFRIDVQNHRAVRYPRFSVRDVKREASLTAVLAIPYCPYSHRW